MNKGFIFSEEESKAFTEDEEIKKIGVYNDLVRA